MSGGWQPKPTSVVPQPPITSSARTSAKTDFIQQYLLTVLSTGQHSHWESENIINNKSWELIHGE